MSEIVKTCQVVRLAPGQAVEDVASATQRPPATADCIFNGSRVAHYVPVSFVAKDWKVSSRRIRVLLTSFRLEGLRRENGYWEVAYPYRFTFGLRGPALKRQQKPERRKE